MTRETLLISLAATFMSMSPLAGLLALPPLAYGWLCVVQAAEGT